MQLPVIEYFNDLNQDLIKKTIKDCIQVADSFGFSKNESSNYSNIRNESRENKIYQALIADDVIGLIKELSHLVCLLPFLVADTTSKEEILKALDNIGRYKNFEFKHADLKFIPLILPAIFETRAVNCFKKCLRLFFAVRSTINTDIIYNKDATTFDRIKSIIFSSNDSYFITEYLCISLNYIQYQGDTGICGDLVIQCPNPTLLEEVFNGLSWKCLKTVLSFCTFDERSSKIYEMISKLNLNEDKLKQCAILITNCRGLTSNLAGTLATSARQIKEIGIFKVDKIEKVFDTITKEYRQVVEYYKKYEDNCEDCIKTLKSDPSTDIIQLDETTTYIVPSPK